MSLNRVKMNKLFNKETKQGKRNIIALTVVLYWIVFWILPSVFLSVFYELFNNFLARIFNYILSISMEGFVYYFVIVAPLISVVLFIFLKNKINVLEKYNIKFFLLTIIIPYIYILLFFFYALSQIEFGGSWI